MKKIAVLATAAFLGAAGFAVAEPAGFPHETAQEFAVSQDARALTSRPEQDRGNAGYAVAPRDQYDYSISR